MIRFFKCKNCNKEFEADYQDSVLCPHCHSDNVEPVSHHISKLTWRILASAFFVMLACFVILFTTSRCESTCDSDDIPDDVPGVDTIISSDPPTVSVSQPLFNDNGKYSVDVIGKNIPKGIKYYYVMLSHFDEKVLQKNEDGHFSNISYCEEDGHSYDFAIMDSRADTLICIPVEQTGFVRQVTIDSSKKMTSEQLQKLIDVQDESLNGVGESDYLAPDYQLKFVGLPPDMKKPESWTEMFEIVEYGIIDRITVSQLSYDDKNRINTVVLKVTMP